MFEAWGRALSRRRWLTLGVTLVLVAFAAAWGTGVFGKLSSGDDFTPPASQSQREAGQAGQVFGRDGADVVVLYRSAAMTVTDPGYRRAVTAALATLPRADVTRVGNSEVTANIAKAEGFSMQVLLILLLVIFGSLAAASLPVAIGGVAERTGLTFSRTRLAGRAGGAGHGPPGGTVWPSPSARLRRHMNQPDIVPEVLSADLPAGVFLLDVREHDEWVAGHAPEAIHMRLGELRARADELPRDREVYVICRSGARSAYAAQMLAVGGLNTVNVADGMTGWAVAGLPMVSEHGAEPYIA